MVTVPNLVFIVRPVYKLTSVRTNCSNNVNLPQMNYVVKTN
jgi:hypothetical protein